MKKTVVIGASPDPSRFSNKATRRLASLGYEVVLIGKKEGYLDGHPILKIQDEPDIKDVHTVTMYINSRNQYDWYEYILGLSPNRIIFNPGSENIELSDMARNKGIEVEFACSLIMLNTGIY